MDFTLSPEIEDIRLRTGRFVEGHALLRVAGVGETGRRSDRARFRS